MQRLLLPATIFFLVTLATLTACSDPTPAPETLAPAFTPASTASPTASPTPTETPAPTEAPTERPTAAPTATPSSFPIPDPTATPVSLGVLAPLQALDISALLSELSANELACIGDDAGKLVRSLTGPSSAPREEQAKLIGCLEDETVARIFLAGFAPGSGPLSLETSDCVRAGFAVIDPREVMTAGIEGDPGRAMAGSMAAFSVTMACLTDEEWEETAPMLGMSPDEQAGMQCLMEALGGPGQMAAAMTAAQEGEFAELASAGTECGLDMGPAPSQAPATPPPAPTSTTTLVITVAPITAGIPDYARDDWKHWTDADGDCQDARQESLVAESLVPVIFETDRECRVATGRWYGAFTGVYVEDPSDLDIDHLVPLKNAHLSGGWSWDAEMKEEYANDLSDPDHLIAVTVSANRSKGAKGPEEWGPPEQSYWCDYATDWTEVKARWELTMTKVESEIVMDMLGTHARTHRMVDAPGSPGRRATGKHQFEPEEESESSVYQLCEEAESAGEQRVQGSQGSGRGFPKATVPSARDWDGDGIVCER